MVFQACGQFFALGILTAVGVGVQAAGGDASSMQRVKLQVKVLAICRNSGVPDAVSFHRSQECSANACLADFEKLTEILTLVRLFDQM